MISPSDSRYVFKICILGSGGIGKTCYANRLCLNKYDDNTKLTIGIDFYSYELPIIVKNEHSIVSATIWDFGGQEQFQILFPSYINGVNGVLMVFSLISMQSLIRLDWWYDRLFNNVDKNKVPRVVLGTKYDLIQTESEIGSELGPDKINDLVIDQFLYRHDEKDFFRCSSKENYNISESFKVLIKKILDNQNMDYDWIP